MDESPKTKRSQVLYDELTWWNPWPLFSFLCPLLTLSCGHLKSQVFMIRLPRHVSGFGLLHEQRLGVHGQSVGSDSKHHGGNRQTDEVFRGHLQVSPRHAVGENQGASRQLPNLPRKRHLRIRPHHEDIQCVFMRGFSPFFLFFFSISTQSGFFFCCYSQTGIPCTT